MFTIHGNFLKIKVYVLHKITSGKQHFLGLCYKTFFPAIDHKSVYGGTVDTAKHCRPSLMFASLVVLSPLALPVNNTLLYYKFVLQQ